MITEALIHCAGVGPVRLAELHQLGVRNWRQAIERADCIPSGYRETVVDECQRCLSALQRRDVAYFNDRFQPQDKWRILSQFIEETTFFDIETTGLDYDAQITVIACWHRGQMHTFVEHENLDGFLELLDDVTLLASFNGSSFDVPRVIDAFHIPALPCPHLDLRWSCYHRGLHGTLKSISRRFGITRPADLQDADGALAVQLWNRWMLSRDHAAREQLLRYCSADVLLLAMLAEKITGRTLRSEQELWEQLPEHEKTSNVPLEATPSNGYFGDASPTRMRARKVRAAG